MTLTMSDKIWDVTDEEGAMSDGPHRSLPLKKHWKDVAERASRPAYVASEISNAFARAVALEAAEAPFDIVRRLLGAGGEGSLFAGDRNALADQLESARAHCRGSASGNALLDGAVQAVLEGEVGDAAFDRAAAHCGEKIGESHNRSIEEHYQRKAGDRSARFMRGRLREAAALCEPAAIVRDIARSGTAPNHSARLDRHTGLDEGPPL